MWWASSGERGVIAGHDVDDGPSNQRSAAFSVSRSVPPSSVGCVETELALLQVAKETPSERHALFTDDLKVVVMVERAPETLLPQPHACGAVGWVILIGEALRVRGQSLVIDVESDRA